MPFESIAEQEGVACRLRTALETGRLPHAYLFVGSVGTGRLAVARELARIILCSGKQRPDDYCGQCTDCRLFEKGNHPDYVEIGVPQGKQLLPIESVREQIQRPAALKPVRAARRVFVMREAERMTLEAANCFLKTLEEPPGGCFFILIASSLRQIPETIVSRCQTVRFGNMSPELLRPRLEASGLEAEDAWWLARRAWGSPGMAERFRQTGLHVFNRELVERLHVLSLEDNFIMSDWFRSLAAQGTESAAESRLALQELLECAAVYYRDLALTAAGGDECDLCNRRAKARIKETAGALPQEAFLDRADAVLETIEAIGSNANMALALDCMFTRLTCPFTTSA